VGGGTSETSERQPLAMRLRPPLCRQEHSHSGGSGSRISKAAIRTPFLELLLPSGWLV